MKEIRGKRQDRHKKPQQKKVGTQKITRTFQEDRETSVKFNTDVICMENLLLKLHHQVGK